MEEMRVVRAGDARVYFEGSEKCHEYVQSDRLTFGTSELKPGEIGAVDPGHPHSIEVFFVSRGTVRMRNPAEGPELTLNEGDAVVVPDGVPHELKNVGDIDALVTWSVAPTP